MINIIYEDNHLLVVEKKPNILVQADNTKDVDLLTLLKDYLKEKYYAVYIYRTGEKLAVADMVFNKQK